MVKVDYNYDTGLDQYTESTNFNNDGAVPVNYDVLQNLYNINSLEDAYLKVYRTNNKKYAKLQAGILVKSERIKKAMKEELKPVLQALGISPELVLQGIRDIATDEEAKHSDKLKALFELGEILELKETNKVTEVTGALFQGFQPEQIQATQRPQLKE